ncbi:hypothetical protein KIPB_012128 [Kipferlia bialata]|uniref:PAC1-like LisH-like dimerisation domain-containing protein n=1 Tax=Kipferlia bialata TaxID=797122 RepID=A0A9K3D7G2_9EUKA|nr:hypothetical protein KIPB_012128 [Kipferlia bialata]|eukprot:g12128.t1
MSLTPKQASELHASLAVYFESIGYSETAQALRGESGTDCGDGTEAPFDFARRWFNGLRTARKVLTLQRDLDRLKSGSGDSAAKQVFDIQGVAPDTSSKRLLDRRSRRKGGVVPCALSTDGSTLLVGDGPSIRLLGTSGTDSADLGALHGHTQAVTGICEWLVCLSRY